MRAKKLLSGFSLVFTVGILMFLASLLLQPYIGGTDWLEGWLERLGPMGPVLYVVVEALMLLVPVVSGQPYEILGGALFGWWAVPLSLLGSMLGCTATYFLGKKYGRRLLERTVKKETLEEFGFFLEDENGWVLWLVSLVPFLPDDLVTFGAGLTRVSYLKYMVLLMLSRPLALAMNTAIGVGVADSNLVVLGSVVAIVIAAFVLFAVKRKAIVGWLRGRAKRDVG